MTVKVNNAGFVVKRDGKLLETSEHSAISGLRLAPGAITMPVAGLPGIYVRMAGGEAAALSDEQRAQIARDAAERFSPKKSQITTVKKEDSDG